MRIALYGVCKSPSPRCLTPFNSSENELLKQQTLQSEASAKATAAARAYVDVEPPEELSDLEALMRAK